MLVPAKLPARSVRVNITLDERLLSPINAAARAAGEDRSAYLAEAAKERMAR
ncbi:type II toxin-antitoxin system HicB family antitoxin [Ancylobacter vacuolatus]|uniref:Metal-responsive CopG/Arc/MetJ family transcriptional regulator n=1 Tax=Ancylobacter vacuolatus TaxID=223389 RepID=A0ABU0DBM3_9HYPH|nr:type II toxin-antitoxin system HicB family antitoxin [Ancylobacter vacuolatus]MDQ0345810.1 metal-responsive CopG/Arc/MetJ family transcriptional regulator [Ancylobacter vacuolatus]